MRALSGVRAHGHLRAAGAFLAAVSLIIAISGTAAAVTNRDRSSKKAKASDFKVAIFLPGGKGADGYNENASQAAALIRKKLDVSVTVATRVATATQDQTYAEFASKGYNLVVGYSGSFATGAEAEAAKYPNTDFLVVDADASNGKNLGSFTITQTTWQYVGGYLAGELAKSGVVGWIGGECFTDTVRNEIGSEEGLKAENPKAKFVSTYLGSWTTPAKAEQSADAMISDGADVIMGNQDTGWTGIDKAAEDHPGTSVIDEFFNDHKIAPSVIASSVLKSQAPYLLEYAKSALDGHYMAKFTNFHMNKTSGPAISKTPLISEKDYKAALEIQKEIASGKLKVSKQGKCTT